MDIQIEQEYTTYTVEQIYEALVKDGFEHLRGQWFSYSGDDPDKVVGACILGQTALNLGVPANHDFNHRDNLVTQLNRFKVTDKSLCAYNLEDGERWSESVGNLIMDWNDVREVDKEGNETDEYVLKTYAEVAEKARLILEPFFAETVQLPHFNY